MKHGLPVALGISLFALHAEAVPPKVVVIDFHFDNTSMQPTSAAEWARIVHISDELRGLLQKSEDFDVIDQKPA